jgi:replicative DNA helicase
MADIIHDADAERAVIATAIQRNTYLSRLMELEPNDFYSPENALLLTVMRDLHNAGQAVDIPVIKASLVQRGKTESFDAVKIDELHDDVMYAVTYNFDWMFDRVLDLSKKRKLSLLGTKIIDAAAAHSTTTDELVERIDRAVSEINRDRSAKAVSVSEVAGAGEAGFVEAEKYLTTGLPDLDSVLLGLFGGQLIIIGARPGVGKSAVALQMAEHIARTGRVLFFSLEMPRKQIIRRMITRRTGIPANAMRSGTISGGQRTEVKTVLKEIERDYKELIVIDNATEFYTIANTIKKQHDQFGLACVMIDYLQLCRMKSQDKRYLQLGEMTATLKAMSIKYSIPIVVLSQLNRIAENKTPELSELRESGNIEQDADVVIFPHRPNMKEGKVELIIAKNRDGSIGFKKLFFNAPRLTFASMTDVEE